MKYRVSMKSRDRWPLWLWTLIVFLFASLVFAIWAAFDLRATAIASVGLFFLLLYLSMRTPQEISVDNDFLYVGKAKISRSFISGCESLNGPAMARARGPGLDPAAYLALRFWVPHGLKIAISDPLDPTPYWLVSTEKAPELIQALQK